MKNGNFGGSCNNPGVDKVKIRTKTAGELGEMNERWVMSQIIILLFYLLVRIFYFIAYQSSSDFKTYLHP